MIERSAIIDKLERVVEKATTFAIQRGTPLQTSKKSHLIGNTLVEKNDLGMYDILNLNGTRIYENISVFDVAIIIAQRYSAGETGVVRQVLTLDEKFTKYHADMLHYLHCYKGAKKRQDYEKMAILEDKFQVAELMAKDTRDKISIFKRVK